MDRSAPPKQVLLKRFRRNKRLAMLGITLGLCLLAAAFAWWLMPVGLLLAWIIHEAAFADHLFYSPREDYRYCFPESAPTVSLTLHDSLLGTPAGLTLGDPERDTLILRVRLECGWSGYWFDPCVEVGDDVQTFERGVHGIRYLNLTGQGALLLTGAMRISARHCRLVENCELVVFPRPALEAGHVMVLAPHADDAELAAFGLYRSLPSVSIVTLTQGEIEARQYCKHGLATDAAARLKGRLRAWDSQAIPLWGGVSPENCVQLGYYCLRLSAMQAQVDVPYPSRESGEHDIRSVRRHNALSLPADTDGVPSWRNLVADLGACIQHFRPQYILLPHPDIDPHPDHVATHAALCEAMAASGLRPTSLLLYTNHLHDNDRWPMGNAGDGVSLPPLLIDLPADAIFSHPLDHAARLDKALALGMQHDLQAALPLKQRLRRSLQRALVGRSWPVTGEDEYFRKAVRRHEMFWVRVPLPRANG